MRTLTLGCLGFIVAPVLLLVGIGTVANAWPARFTPTQSTPTSTLSGPTVVGRWTSSGDLTTEPIIIHGTSVRFDVVLREPIKSYSQVCLSVKRRDGQHIRAECRQETGPTRIYLSPGSYYVEVSAIGPWAMVASDLP